MLLWKQQGCVKKTVIRGGVVAWSAVRAQLGNIAKIISYYELKKAASTLACSVEV